MKERLIPVKPHEVRAILDGSMTQTRRVFKGSPCFVNGEIGNTCPHGQVGDQLWVRETFSPVFPQDPNYNNGQPIEYDYSATYTWGDRLGDHVIGKKKKWKPSIFMPRAASRITLEITSVRVERLQDISEADCIAEGIEKTNNEFWSTYGATDVDGTYSPKTSYRCLWESINGAGSWDLNPLVWVIEFKKVKP